MNLLRFLVRLRSLLLLPLLLLASCDDPAGPPVPLTLTPAPLTLGVGESQAMTAAGADGEVTWSSSDVNVATVVASSGMVAAVGPGTAMITATSGQQTGQASLTVTAPEMALSSTSLSFAATAGQTSPPAQTVNISNAARGILSGLSGTITFPAGQPSGWLTAALSSTTAPATLTLTANPATLQTGSYTATVAIRSSISGVPEKTVSVTFAVAQGPAIGLSGTTASFNAFAGGESPAVQSLNVTNAGGGTLTEMSGVVTYGAGQPSGWLTAALNSTTAPATLTLTARPADLEPGSYTATVTLRSTVVGVAETSVNVTFTVAQGAVIGLSTPSVSFSATAGQASPAAQMVQVTNTGAGRLAGLSGTVTYGAGLPTGWLTAALSSTTAPATLTLTVSTGSLAAGTYTATVALRSSLAGVAEKSVNVTFTITGSAAVAARLEQVASGLNPGPVYLTAPPGESRLFVAGLDGKIWVVQQGQVSPDLFLDLRGKVTLGFYTGLFSLAFHPNYSSNGYFYVYYIDRDNNIRFERYRASADPNRADPASAKLILTITPGGTASDHYGGHLSFGPDGKLYVGVGDGGIPARAQDKGSLLGKLLRIDVDAGDPYTIPSENPFVGQAGARGEIWALGLRNPWRWSIDHQTGVVFIGDVGENHWEEINVTPLNQGGINFGWPIMEGMSCYPASVTTCNRAGLTLPAIVYATTRSGTSVASGCSVTGGYVYRGSRIPGLRGEYFYADYCQGWVRSFRYQQGSVVEPRLWAFPSVGRILSFGQDAAGELYILNDSGSLYRIVPENGS
jgi:glucose/arabinose dehydrogenase